jgi:hypothetical protein
MVIEHKMHVLIFSTVFVQNISHSKNNVGKYCRKCEKAFMYSTRIFCRILTTLEISRQIFEEKAQLTRFIKIRTVGAEMFHADGMT